MEIKRLILAIVVTAAILLGWEWAFNYVGTKMGYDMSAKPVAPTIAANDPATSPAPATTQASLPGGTTAPTVAGINGVLTVQGGPATQPVVILGSTEEKNAQYAVALHINPIGASYEAVTINNSRKAVGQKDLYQFQHAYAAAPVSSRPMAISKLLVNGAALDLSGVAWKLDSAAKGPESTASATFFTDIVGPGGPMLTVRKTFTVSPIEEGGANGARGFDTRVNFEFVNRTPAPMTIRADIAGPTLPPPEVDRGPDRSFIAGYRGERIINFKHEGVEAFDAKHPNKQYSHNKDGEPVVWFGTASTYFNAIMRPELSAGMNKPDFIQSVDAIVLNPTADSFHKEIVLTLTTTDLTIAPGDTRALPFRVYLGPKQRSLLQNAYYEAPLVAYNESLTLSGGCTYCTFQPVVDTLMKLLKFFHWIFKDWGIAIIALVILVRTLLHPITKRSQVSMAKMSKMGPEMEKLKAKYKDDKEGLNRAMVQFYKTQGAAPVIGCLPMFLQMPIWVALYSGLSGTFELRQEHFLYGLTWIKDLARPDHLVEFAPDKSLNLLFLHVSGINVLPMLLAIAFFVQMKLQPKPVAVTPEQQQQQKMMQWMTLLFPVMLYSGPSGLNLYILTSTTIGIIESKIIRNHIKEQEAKVAAGPIIIDAPVTKAKVRRRGEPEPAPAKGGGIAGWLANLQQRAEDLRNDAEKRTKKPKN